MENMKWTKLATMAIFSFLVMYILMYVMIDKYANVYLNLDQLYMVVLMTSAMMFIEITMMKSMYSTKVQIVTASFSIVVFILFFILTRNQIAISDKEFLKSMIAHHGSALFMCENAKLNDFEVKKLCESITSSQQEQINWMREKLSTLK